MSPASLAVTLSHEEVFGALASCWDTVRVLGRHAALISQHRWIGGLADWRIGGLAPRSHVSRTQSAQRENIDYLITTAG
jgi:hypothetical protein